MGHKHEDEQQAQPTQANVEQAVASGIAAGELPPQSLEQRDGQRLCGKAVRMLVGAHMETVFLTDYDASSNSYHGIAIRNFSMNTGENPPVFEAVHGARPYPTTDRPNYAWQFIAAGDDESVLINIAHDNLAEREG